MTTNICHHSTYQ